MHALLNHVTIHKKNSKNYFDFLLDYDMTRAREREIGIRAISYTLFCGVLLHKQL